jgi:UDPglucose--hexose-1-phosphate uridylyltransferase
MEYRKDPLVDRWVIIAPERSSRPHDFVDSAVVRRRGVCPFCGGNESDTTAEIDALREPDSAPNGPGWRVRAVSNKFPFLRCDQEWERGRVGAGETRSVSTLPLSPSPTLPLFFAAQAAGPHEVLIDSPRHVVRASQLSITETADALRLYQRRLVVLRGDSRLRHVQIFKNVGEAAGASIEHLHGQLAGLTFVPPPIVAEVEALKRHRARFGRCVHCETIAAELATGTRIVETTPGFVVACPYASGFSYEIEIAPRAHSADFAALGDSGLLELAGVLRRTLVRLENVLPSPAYNLLWKSEPFDSFTAGYYHWRLAVLPRTAKTAGFEWSTGILVNPVPPEEAAAALRRAASE